jgi:chaperonin GroES
VVAALCWSYDVFTAVSTGAGTAPTYCTFVNVSSARAARQPAPLGEKLPVRMLHDRLLVSLDSDTGERRSGAGIVIPATARMGKRLAWAVVVAVGNNVRSVEIGDRVLFDPEDRAEVELHGSEYVLLREREIHAVASERIQDGATGLYL